MTPPPSAWPLSTATLQALPPAHRINYRTERYAGGTFTVPLAAFAPPDQVLLRDLYQMLTTLWGLLTAAPHTEWPLLLAVRAAVGRSGWDGVLAALPQLGVATTAQPHPTQLAGVLDAVRRGNLAVLAGTLPLLGLGPVTLDAVIPLVGLVRDHVSTLRTTIPDLDPVAAAADHRAQPQSLDRLVEKWRYPPYGVGHTVAHVRVAGQVAGAVAAQPRELAAVDSVLTTLIMHAVQQAMDGTVDVVLVPHGAGQDVRIVVYHRHPTGVGAAGRTLVAGAGPPTSRGRGWQICAAYVADCYGVPTVQQCLQNQYLAADLIDGYGVAWFHWPLVPLTDAW
jgi:hypothetical protein